MPVERAPLPWIPSHDATILRTMLQRLETVVDSLYATADGVVPDTSLREAAGIISEMRMLVEGQAGFRTPHFGRPDVYPSDAENVKGSGRVQIGEPLRHGFVAIPEGETAPQSKPVDRKVRESMNPQNGALVQIIVNAKATDDEERLRKSWGLISKGAMKSG